MILKYFTKFQGDEWNHKISGEFFTANKLFLTESIVLYTIPYKTVPNAE